MIFNAFINLLIKILIFVFPFSIGVQLQSQTKLKDLGTWNIVSMNVNYKQKWIFFAEFQLRSLSPYSQFHYYELKGGSGFSPLPELRFFLGAGTYNTYSAGGNFKLPYNQREIRIWQQFSTRQNIKKFQLEHRYRAEQRHTNMGYRNRFRYRLGIVIPFWYQFSKHNSFFITCWNEIFLTHLPSYFERNRFSLGFGYEWNFFLTTLIGWVHQLDYRVLDEIGKNFFQFTLLFNFNYDKKNESSITPTSIE